MQRTILNYDQWVEHYQPHLNMISQDESSFNNTLFETFGKEAEYVQQFPENRVWTLIENDGRQSIVAGWHQVNRLGYFLTLNPFEDEGIEVPLDD